MKIPADGVSLVIFDLDGTLVDSAPAVEAALNRVRVRKGLEPVEAETVQAVLSGQAREVDVLAAPGAGGKARRDALMLFGRILAETSPDHSRLYPGVPDVLDALKMQGVQTAVVSSRITLFVHELLHHMGLDDRFDPIVGVDRVASPPPAPDAVQFVLEHTGTLPGQALLVADGADELEAGRAAGVRTLFASYGYGTVSESAADAVLRQPVDLLHHGLYIFRPSP